MAAKRFLETDKSYSTALIIAGIILCTVFIITFNQFIVLGDTGRSATKNLDTYRSMEELFTTYQNLEIQQLTATLHSEKNANEQWQQLLNDSEILLIKLKENLENNTIQLERLSKIEAQQQLLVEYFNKYSASDGDANTIQRSIRLKELVSIVDGISIFKDDMLADQKNIVDVQLQHFNRESRLTPIIFVIATLISLLIMLISFYKIYKDKKNLTKTTGFLESILNSTKAIANLYTPIYSKNNSLKDFEIEYASAANTSITKSSKDELKGKTVREQLEGTVAGDVDNLIESFLSKKEVNEIVTSEIDGKTIFYRKRLFPTDNDLKVIITDITESKEKTEEIKMINADLEVKNEVLEEAEKMAKLGSYIWFMEEDYTILSDNVYRIMGYKPQEFESSSKKFREFTHPEDIELYDKHVLAAFTDYKPVEFIFRIITKQGKIKHLYTNGAFSNRNNKTIMIGIIQDVSKRIFNETKLEEQNIELKRRNAELDSFNRIASHDLQEPLRKVQMYLSRIEESEKGSLSKKGLQYFDRVHDATSRMRSLINNLLAFSRIDRKDFKFEKVDLNQLLTDVQNHFSLKISEVNASITIEELPKVKGISFQLEQLFMNLIGNALKFIREDTPPKIHITASKIHHRQISEDFVKMYTYYYVIKIMDNGIGFSQNNSEKIFELFQRLHEKHEYTGTGIGLAICKKIVQKHQGHIHATSVKDQGSAFIIYLPSGKLKTLPKDL